MDIRRLPLWEGRNATYLSNDIFSALIEDQGEVVLDITSKSPSGARMNALSLPYFRATGSGVMSDENGSWWQGKQSLYQAGGAYFTFPSSDEEKVNSSSTYWLLRKYGTEEEKGGVWRLSEMKSREIGNRYRLRKADLVLPSHPVLYTAIQIENTGDETLHLSPSWHSMLGSPLIETGSFISSNAGFYVAYGLSKRETGVNRFLSGQVFDSLKHAPLVRGGVADAGFVPPPTGTYDYIIGKIPEKDPVGWVSVINPRIQMIYFSFSPRLSDDSILSFPNIDLTENYCGRMDAPWALFDGATPQVRAVTAGFNTGPKGSENVCIEPGGKKTVLIGNAFMQYENPRMGMGFYSSEFNGDGVVLKRTKSWLFIPLEHGFQTIRKLSGSLFSEESV